MLAFLEYYIWLALYALRDTKYSPGTLNSSFNPEQTFKEKKKKSNFTSKKLLFVIYFNI